MTISNAHILVDASDTAVRSVIVSVIKTGLEEAGFGDITVAPTGSVEDKLHTSEKLPSVLDSLRESRPEVFNTVIEMSYGLGDLVPGDAVPTVTEEEQSFDDVEL